MSVTPLERGSLTVKALRAKLLTLQDQARIQLDDSVIVGEDMGHKLWGSRCVAHCVLCGEHLIIVESRQRWWAYQRAGGVITGHPFSCEASQLSSRL